ncbi:hypothetical protein NQZ68_009062 [Dissostichus eleginoides]|nr:hypothetical protein NQZ68_009062 [Dissostichus eleginoides]
MHVCAYQRQKNVLCWRLLSTVIEQCRCTELQKERGILRFLGFSQPSPRCRFHITADSKPRRRRRHAPSVLQPCSHPKRTVLYQILLTQNKNRLEHCNIPSGEQDWINFSRASGAPVPLFASLFPLSPVGRPCHHTTARQVLANLRSVQMQLRHLDRRTAGDCK